MGAAEAANRDTGGGCWWKSPTGIVGSPLTASGHSSRWWLVRQEARWRGAVGLGKGDGGDGETRSLQLLIRAQQQPRGRGGTPKWALAYLPL